MAKVTLFSDTGVKKGNFELPKDFDEKLNLKLLAQAIHVYEDRSHPGLARVKSRGEVALSTRKIYRQKGTGGARHGAKSAPIFVGGGVTHGPKGVKRQLKLSDKLRLKALKIALNLKLSQDSLFVVDGFSTLKKTKVAQALIDKICGDKKSNTTVVLAGNDKSVILVLRNIKNIETVDYKDLNAYKVYFGGTMILDKRIFDSKSAAKQSIKKVTKAKVVVNRKKTVKPVKKSVK
ncbi:50S ribosomal protein L4 [Candidatus Woesebacteria bacterium RIFCSPLOWO2_01_FULL_39_23]|uniref:Large ribosomal subunit protein uL4 n=3 Tax=Microgenomates group TaxID=1794810 RepID=A0A0H4TX45_9BACT|nr:50S ribosomal protein L4 [uncultured Microgenomates bacterium Rifle_16ft_4_minimus_37633]AKQ05549.1 50S ribosomal protein L4 [uncultured Microgenomates bacterium Rifle_16ft_4_minimus_24053]OGM13875.1 MAG: 50S ribosomal protein L4 [Candidatus Woesebacteria bacterium RBG_16_40_11]OGM27827.1 MAG: 50S ribosomal protein L4 [Candidatus Woesebacteria bacterium RIFCSPHIGHO2_01_FULL_40_22]OGM36063.1 MAG: 50S ribosomal protein L4 [Candidatus Woesebacteria bacterium RIFCSPHIGHO2_12_FULL_38_9]OGM62249.